VFEFDEGFKAPTESNEFRRAEVLNNYNSAERDSVFSIPTLKNILLVEGAYKSDSQTEKAESVLGANSNYRGPDELSKQKLPLIIPPRRFNTTVSQHAAQSEDGQHSSQDFGEVPEGVEIKRPTKMFKEDEIEPPIEPESEGVQEAEPDEEFEQMAKILGFSSFGTTKGKDHTKTAVEGIHKNKDQVPKFRQYMNRKGGCHLPLPIVKD
jgi:U4/U6.U5 small nuclear ribonucleoproteins